MTVPVAALMGVCAMFRRRERPVLSACVVICGLGLNTKPEEQYRAWLEATAFGFRRILDQYEMYGVDVDNICVSGGIALKNPLLMQIYADVTGRRLSVSGAKQSGALGSACIF